MNRRKFLGAMTTASAASLVGVAPVEGQTLTEEHRVQSSSSNGEEILDNGMVRLAFNRSTGEFRAQSASSAGVVELFEAGPAVTVTEKGQELKARDASRVEVRREPFEDVLGTGQKLIAQYEYSAAGRNFRYELSFYDGKPWVSATVFLPAGDYSLDHVDVVRGRMRVPGAFKTRLYVCSGQAGGDTGVWDVGLRRWESSALSVVYDPNVQEAIMLGFYSFYRAEARVMTQYLKPNELGVAGTANYYGYQPAKGELRTESLLLNFGQNPVKMLEEWAESAVKVVKPQFLHDTSSSYLNTWYMYGDQTTQEDTILQAKLLRDSVLHHYGVKIVTTGEWQQQRRKPGDEGDALGFGEDQEDKTLYPNGIKWLVDQIHALGLEASFGANYCYAGMETSLVKQNVPWLVREDVSRMGFGYPIDFTHPDAQKWLYRIAHRTVEFGAAEWWCDFMGGPTRGKLYDPDKIMRFEDIREGISTIRRAVGPNILVEPACCGPYFPFLGVVDRDRTGDDCHALGDFDGLKATARQLAAMHMVHQRFWINNPDPLIVGGRDFVHNPGSGPIPYDPAMMDEVRMRIQYHVTTGGFLTVGQNLQDFDAERYRLLTLVVPSYGQSARPVDLFIHTTPEIHDLKVKTDWEEWHTLILQNWNDEEKTYDLALKELDLDETRPYLVFRFWDQAFLGQFRTRAKLRVGGRQGETFAIREATNHPWVLGTDMHLTQGGVELQEVRYDQNRLSGTALRHPGAQGQVVVYAPPGYGIQSASGSYRVDQQSSGAAVIYLKLDFSQANASWSIAFKQQSASLSPWPSHTSAANSNNCDSCENRK